MGTNTALAIGFGARVRERAKSMLRSIESTDRSNTLHQHHISHQKVNIVPRGVWLAARAGGGHRATSTIEVEEGEGGTTAITLKQNTDEGN